MILRRLMSAGLMLIGGAAMLVLLVNLSWFDESLLPEIEALRVGQPMEPHGNGYPLAVGFLAAEGRDPRAAGLQIVNARVARRDRGAPTALAKEEMQAVLGMPLANDGLAEPLGFTCQARHRHDCAERLLARLDAIDLDDLRLARLLERYEALLGHAHFVETPPPDFATPWPPLGPIVALGRLRLAISFRADPTATFLEKASQDLRFWRVVLREGQLLGMKMSALAAIRNTHDFISTMVRERQLEPGDIEVLRRVVRPFTSEERDIGAAFVSEARAHLLMGTTPVEDSPWLRPVMQRNATFNQYYRETIEPMRFRSSLDARDYYERKAFEPLRHEFRMTPAMFYNLVGKLASRRSTWDSHQFPSRVHDEDGRIALLLLQAQIEERPGTDVADLIRTSDQRNPYTGEAMEYDPQGRTIGFACLHTAFHPPELADRCDVYLGREGS